MVVTLYFVLQTQIWVKKRNVCFYYINAALLVRMQRRATFARQPKRKKKGRKTSAAPTQIIIWRAAADTTRAQQNEESEPVQENERKERKQFRGMRRRLMQSPASFFFFYSSLAYCCKESAVLIYCRKAPHQRRCRGETVCTLYRCNAISCVKSNQIWKEDCGTQTISNCKKDRVECFFVCTAIMKRKNQKWEKRTTIETIRCTRLLKTKPSKRGCWLSVKASQMPSRKTAASISSWCAYTNNW